MEVQFTQLDTESLKREIFEGVFEMLKPALTDGLLTRAEVAEFYKVALSTVASWVKDGKIKEYGIGNERRYKKSELMENLILIKS